MPAHLFTVTTPAGHRYTPSLRCRIVAMLKFMSPAGADLPTLVDYCYGDDPEGGPLHPADVIGHTIARLRRAGHAIVGRGRGTGRCVLTRP